ncbi:MAG: lipid-A-disaccharide synthase N-terminal domain-containing protein [Candidatus Omnitrophica bacterium]|nr:lipid-A-disaccharide synthase N-terminal domain-containing protein [Candidatus Omnitrophota bacterium]
MKINIFWLIIGLTGQAFFTLRFLIQWITTEKKRESVVPEMFWHFSIIGSLLLLSYAIYRRDPVFILGQSLGSIVYFRNLYFIHKEKRHADS